MIHNNKVYANADEKFVKGTIVYVSENIGVDGNRHLFYDIEETKPVLYSELKGLFLSGLFVAWGNELYIPNKYFKEYNSDHCYVTVNTDGEIFPATAPTEE